MADDEQQQDPGPQVIGLKGDPIQHPTGRWLAAVDQDGNLVRQDGMLVKVRD